MNQYRLSPESKRRIKELILSRQARGQTVTPAILREAIRPDVERSMALQTYQKEQDIARKNRASDILLGKDRLALQREQMEFEKDKLEKQQEEQQANNRAVALQTGGKLISSAYDLYTNPPSFLRPTPKPTAFNPEAVPSATAGDIERAGGNILKTSVENYLTGGETIAPLASSVGEVGSLAVGSPAATPALQLSSGLIANPALMAGSEMAVESAAAPALTGISESIAGMGVPAVTSTVPAAGAGAAGAAAGAGAATGATTGAEMGTTVSPVVGTVIGGIVGAAIGAIAKKFLSSNKSFA